MQAAADSPLESLEQKKLLLHHHNYAEIRFEETFLPTNNPQTNLALIYNNAIFLNEDEVRKAPRKDFATLYGLIKAHQPKSKCELTRELVQQCKDTHPGFVQKLLTKQTLIEKYPDLKQQTEAVNTEIDKLKNRQLKSLLHIFVAFYIAQTDNERNQAAALINGLHNKYPIVPRVVESIRCWNLLIKKGGILIPKGGCINVIEDEIIFK